MAERFTIRFVDGSTADVDRRPVHLMRAERVVDANPGVYESLLAMLWAASTGGTGSREEFESWAESVDDWDRVEVADLPPADGSSDSPS